MEKLEEKSLKELVLIYNQKTGKSIKKFESKAQGIKAIMGLSEDKAVEAGVDGDAQGPMPAKTETDEVSCVVCGTVITATQKSRALPKDSKHPDEVRLYHLVSCGPGSKNWKAFKQAGQKTLERPIEDPETGMKFKGKVKKAKGEKADRKPKGGSIKYWIDDKLYESFKEFSVDVKPLAVKAGDWKPRMDKAGYWHMTDGAKKTPGKAFVKELDGHKVKALRAAA